MDRLIASGIVCAGALIFYTAWTFPKSMFSPVDPGTFPSIIGAGLFICGSILLSQSFFGRQAVEPQSDRPKSDGRQELVTGLILLAMLAALAAVFNRVGFLVASGPVAMGLAYLQSRRVIPSIFAGAGIVTIVYLIFRSLLSVPLP